VEERSAQQDAAGGPDGQVQAGRLHLAKRFETAFGLSDNASSDRIAAQWPGGVKKCSSTNGTSATQDVVRFAAVTRQP
jgi:hypothetical protein